jgi:hypothetical protein
MWVKGSGEVVGVGVGVGAGGGGGVRRMGRKE